MFKRLLIAAVLAANVSLCGCSGKTEARPEKVSEKKTETASETVNAEESLPDGVFCELPAEAEADFDYVTEISTELFPDTEGKKMYGYSGLEEIETSDGGKSCYIFEFYTYKSKLYSKVATIAKDSESSDIYLYNEQTGEYELTAIPEREPNWCDRATAALAAEARSTNSAEK